MERVSVDENSSTIKLLGDKSKRSPLSNNVKAYNPQKNLASLRATIANETRNDNETNRGGRTLDSLKRTYNSNAPKDRSDLHLF